MPRRSKRLLPPNYAQEAVNTKLLTGELRGVHSPIPEYTFPAGAPAWNPLRAWRVRSSEHSETYSNEIWVPGEHRETELVKCPLVDDPHDRWYLFEPGEHPKVSTYPEMAQAFDAETPIPWYNLRLNQPTTKPTLSSSQQGTGDVFERVYVYTYITEWGEETTASNPASIKVPEGAPPNDRTLVTASCTAPASDAAGRSFTHIILYRTVNGQNTNEFYECAREPINGQWGQQIDIDDNEFSSIVVLNDTLDSQANENPPNGIYGAKIHSSGAMVAFKGRDVYFSKPYLPHAWPSTSRRSVPDTIVGIETFEQNVGCMTNGRPSILYGSDPSNMGLLKFSFPEPCVAYGSIIAAPEGAYYASQQGLVLLTTVGPQNISEQLLSSEEWQTNYINEGAGDISQEYSAARYGTQYTALKGDGGFTIDTLEPRIALSDIDMYYKTPALDTFENDMYTADVWAISQANRTVYKWDEFSAGDMRYAWKSKQQVFSEPVNFGVVMVHLEPVESPDTSDVDMGGIWPPELSDIDHGREVLVEVYANDEKVWVGACANRTPVKLPTGFKADSWEVAIYGECRVYSISLTETGRGQAGV